MLDYNLGSVMHNAQAGSNTIMISTLTKRIDCYSRIGLPTSELGTAPSREVLSRMDNSHLKIRSSDRTKNMYSLDNPTVQP